MTPAHPGDIESSFSLRRDLDRSSRVCAVGSAFVRVCMCVRVSTCVHACVRVIRLFNVTVWY